MTDTATSRYGARKQSLGSNVNTWGDTKLNDVIDLFDRGSKGYQSLTITGDTTLSWTSYATTNDGQVATLKLAGSLSSAANLIVPSREWAFTVINSTGMTVTVKTSAGTGVDIPTGYQASLYCDATDVKNAAPTVIGAKLGSVTSGTATTDAVNKGQMDTAIAAATTSTTAGTVRVTSTDTTAKFLASAVTQQVGSLTTTQVAGLTSLQISTINAGANEQLAISPGNGYVENFLPAATQSVQFTPAHGYEYMCDFSASSWTINLGGMSSVQTGQKIKLNCYGSYAPFLLGTVHVGGVQVTNVYLDPGFNDVLTRTPQGWN